MGRWIKGRLAASGIISPVNNTEEGLKAMEDWMKELGLAMKISELGVTKDRIDGIADATFLLEGGYKVLKREEVVAILKESL